MPKYQYERLYVSAYEPRDFDPQDPLSLRKAVEHLKTLPQSSFVQLTVEVTIRAGNFIVKAPAAMKLDEIIGKTPKQVWAIFDREIDRQVNYFEARSRGWSQD